jgi:NitT/TauT family transport system permease protein
MSERSASSAHLDYLRSLRRQKHRITFLRILIFVLFLVLWELAVRMKWIDGFIFSSPSRIVQTFLRMAEDGTIFVHIGVTLYETLISFVLVLVVGTGTALLLWYHSELSRILEPYLVVLNSLPKSALAPLLIVWLGANMKSIIVSGISVAVFGTILNLYTGFSEVDPDMIKLIYTLKGTKKDVLKNVIIPGNIPLLVSIMKVNIGLCLVGVVIGEFIGAREGLGYLIIYGSQVFLLAGTGIQWLSSNPLQKSSMFIIAYLSQKKKPTFADYFFNTSQTPFPPLPLKRILPSLFNAFIL